MAPLPDTKSKFLYKLVDFQKQKLKGKKRLRTPLTVYFFPLFHLYKRRPPEPRADKGINCLMYFQVAYLPLAHFPFP